MRPSSRIKQIVIVSIFQGTDRMSMDAFIARLTETAGWAPKTPDEDGIYRFRLAEGLDFEVLSPDGRVCLLLADLGEAPATDTRDGCDTLERIGKLSAAAMRSSRAVVSLDNGRIELFERFELSEVSEEEFCRRSEAFLNDAVRWKTRLGDDSVANLGASPFSFASAGWMSSDFRF